MNYASTTQIEWAVEIEAENDKLIDLLEQMHPMLEDYCDLLRENKSNDGYMKAVASMLKKIERATQGE